MPTLYIFIATLPILAILIYLALYSAQWQDRANARLAVLCYLMLYWAFWI